MRTLSAAEIYALSLLHCHHGYPLWKPKPYDSLPETYRRTGTNLGDVGRVTQDGHFHFLFNALVPADDPINRSGVPRNFEPLTFDANHVLECINYHEPGAPIYTVGTKRHDFAVDATTQIAGTPAEGSGGIELKFEETAGAVLLLPEGATRVDVETIIPFRQYAHTHCEEWYRFAEARGIEVENGSLYFVTGFDKTSSWENAAFSNPTRAASVSLKVVSGIGPGGRIQASQSANLVTPITRGHSPPNCGMNQSVFIRGFKITLRSTARYIFQSPIKVMDLSGGALKDLKPKDVVARGGPVMFNERRSSFSRSQSSSSAPASRNTSGRQGGSHLPSLQRSTSSLANSQRQSDFESLHSYTTFDSDTDLDLGLDSDKDCFEFEDIITKNLAMRYPSNVLNDYLLEKFPDCHVAITHDNDWCQLLDQHDTEIPKGEEIVARAQSRYGITIEDGCVFFQNTFPGLLTMHLNVPTDNEKRSDPECLPESSIGGALRSSPTASPSKIRPSGPSPTPACYFCRARKIVCHRQNPDSPCNQCLRRSNKCEYPIQRRRGMHKKKVITTGNTS